MIRETLKKSQFLVNIYQKLIGYNKKGKHWCRVVMDIETENLVRSLPFSEMNVLEISGEKWRDFGFKSYKNVSFPEFDICEHILPEKYDLIISEQVFEHILWPNKAIVNVHEMLKPGGYFMITTPFLIRIHVMPDDCTRWSPSGMKYFLSTGGFPLENIQTWGWGNKECLIANLDEWMPFNPKRHSLENDEQFPLVVWALAQKKK